MKFGIKNFRNISNIDIVLDEGKVNFIYGISGSGKTSIANAILSAKDEEIKRENIPLGSESEPTVTTSSPDNFSIFNSEIIENYIIEKKGNGFYKLAVEDDSIKNTRNQLEKLFDGSIKSINSICDDYHKKYSDLINHFEFKFNKNGTLSKGGKNSFLTTSETYSDTNCNLNEAHKSWIVKGKDFKNCNICPYCENIMSKEIIDKIEEIFKEYPSRIYTFYESEAISKLQSLQINIPNQKDMKEPVARNEFLLSIQNAYKINEDMKKILYFLSHTKIGEIKLNDIPSKDSEIDKKVSELVSKETQEYFSTQQMDISMEIKRILTEQKKYLGMVKVYNSEIKKIIQENFKEINDFLSSIAISYQIENPQFSEEIGINISYKNIEITETLINPEEYLSTGEKNIFALILFLYENKNKSIIIDDPASSFDEYRRDKIINEIFSVQNKNTILILSHDQIFLKFLFREKNNLKLGKVYHFENNCINQKLKEINNGDIKSFISHIRKSIYNSNQYMQKIINLRLYYEIKNNQSIEYYYLSGILHGKKNELKSSNLKCKLANYLKDNKKSSLYEEENKILKKINEEFSPNLNLSEFDEKFLIDFKISELSDFEKLIYIREKISDAQDKNELNNIVHFNESMVHILNPYKFNFQSKISYGILDKYNRNEDF